MVRTGGLILGFTSVIGCGFIGSDMLLLTSPALAFSAHSGCLRPCAHSVCTPMRCVRERICVHMYACVRASVCEFTYI